jgi:RNA polymerase sigma-70 factor (ECF subfamily)
VTDPQESAIQPSVQETSPRVPTPSGSGTEPSDADLVAAARTDPAAFDAVYRRYLQRIYRYARVRVGTEQDAEDVTTATFIEAMTGLRGYEEQGRFAAWLFTIARRQVLAQRRRSPQHDDVDSLHLATSPELPGDERAVLARALARLTDDRREALLLRFYGGLKVNEIADVLDKGESAVKMLLHRGLGQLREQLGEDPRG